MGMVHNVQSMTSLANALGLDSKNVLACCVFSEVHVHHFFSHMGMVHNVQSMTSLANALGLDSRMSGLFVFF
jgi:hypothetical protein